VAYTEQDSEAAKAFGKCLGDAVFKDANSPASPAGVSDHAEVTIEGWEETVKSVKEKRKEIVASIPKCPVCGGNRIPTKRWYKKKLFASADELEKPWIMCPNTETCNVSPRSIPPDKW
jgi:hypothetical protein